MWRVGTFSFQEDAIRTSLGEVVLKIFRAEGLPSMNSGFMGKIMRDKKVFLDPYVQVTFAGQQVIFFQCNFE